MSTPSSVVGCSSCGALHTPTPNDRGLCSACRRLLVSDVPWRADAAGADPGNGAAAAPKRPDKDKVRRLRPAGNRDSRRIAVGAAVALVVAGLGVVIAKRPKPLSDSWTKIERHMKTGAFSTIRHRASGLWVAAWRQGSDAWLAVRRRLPFGLSDSKGSDSVASAPTSRSGTADATVSSHRRKTASTKRRRDD